MKKQINKSIIQMMLVLCLLCSAFSTTECEAKTTAQKALAAYSRILKADTYKWSSNLTVSTDELEFALYDLNKDGVKELYLYAPDSYFAEGYYCVITYSKGKTKRVIRSNYLYLYKKAKTLLAGAVNTGENSGKYCKITKSGKAVKKLEFAKTDTVGATVYSEKDEYGYQWYYTDFEVNNKAVSWSKYKKARKKLLGTEKSTQLSFKKNTSKNRSKYLK